MFQSKRMLSPLLAAFLATVFLAPLPAAAGPYSRLQVLLPGEAAAPGTPSGRTGTPIPQAAEVPFEVTVRACDDTWSTASTITNTIQVLASDGSATLPAPAQLAAGEGSFTVALNAAGSFTVFAHDLTDNTIPDGVSTAVTVHVLRGFEFSRISQKNQYAGVPMSITLSARDPNGQVVTGFSGEVALKEITSFGEGRISPDRVTLSQGEWSGSVTMYRADETNINRGNVNIYAFLEQASQKNGTSDPFVVHPGSFARLQIVVPGETPVPGEVSGLIGNPAPQAAGEPFPVDIYATDDYWNPVPSGDTVRLLSSDGAANTPQSGALTNGYRQFQVSLGTVGMQTLSVTDQTNGGIEGMTTADIPVFPSSIDHFVIEPFATPLVAGSPVTVTIRATDGNDNTIPEFSGDAVLSANTGSGSMSPELVTFVDGVWTGAVTFRGAGGAVAFTCADFSTPPHTGTSQSFQVQPGPFVKLQVLLPGETPLGGTATGQSGAANDQAAGSSFQVTVRAVDAYWNLVGGISDRVALSSTDPFAEVPADTALVNGQLVVPCRLFLAGEQQITAQDLDQPAIEPDTSNPVLVVAGPFARLLILAPGEDPAPGTESGRSGEATDQSINYAFTVTVLATDEHWNPVHGVSDVVHITSNDPLATLPADTPLTDGAADLTVRLATGGYQQITVEDVSDPSRPGSTTQVRAISSGFHLEAQIDPDRVRAGEPFTLTVRVTNDAGSTIQEINSFVTIEVLNASTREPGRGTLLNTRFQLLQGQRSISETYTFAEPIVLIASDDLGNAPAASNVLTVDPGVPAAVRARERPVVARRQPARDPERARRRRLCQWGSGGAGCLRAGRGEWRAESDRQPEQRARDRHRRLPERPAAGNGSHPRSLARPQRRARAPDRLRRSDRGRGHDHQLPESVPSRSRSNHDRLQDRRQRDRRARDLHAHGRSRPPRGVLARGDRRDSGSQRIHLGRAQRIRGPRRQRRVPGSRRGQGWRRDAPCHAPQGRGCPLARSMPERAFAHNEG